MEEPLLKKRTNLSIKNLVRENTLEKNLLKANLVKSAGFAALIAAAFFPAKYNNSMYGYLPGLSLLVLFLLCWLYLFFLRRQVVFESETLDAQCQRNEMINTTVKITNRSFFSCPLAKTELYLTGFLSGKEKTLPRVFALNGKSKAEFPVQAAMKHIGVYTAGVKDLRIYDFMGIFSLSVRGGESFRVTVLPNTIRTDEVFLDERHLAESQNIQKTAVSDGFDYTGVREYALGDSMKRIHWKLSAHSPFYMTKITESSRQSDLTVILDFVAETKAAPDFPDLYDFLVETALSLMEQAASRDIESTLLFVGREHELVRMSPKGEQDHPELVRKLPGMTPEKDSDLLDGAGILDKEKQLSNRSTNLILCTTRITDRLIQELIAVKQQQRNPELYLIVPHQGENKEEEAILRIPKALSFLEEYGVRCHLISIHH